MIAQFAGIFIRKNIRKHSSCFSNSMQEIIKKLIKSSNDIQIKKNYKERQDELMEWLDKKKLKNIQKGQQVDVRDTEEIWCIGTIREIYSNSNHQRTLLIHYKGRSD